MSEADKCGAAAMRTQRLSDLLPEGSVAVPEVMLSALSLDSREVHPGCGFVALPGTAQHGMAFALQAQAAGAAVIIWQPIAGVSVPPGLTIPSVAVDNLRAHLGDIAAKLYRLPGAALRIVGITGTNGKTSTTRLLADALTRLGLRCGSIGTLGVRLERAGDKDAEVLELAQTDVRTTPDAINVQRTLRGFVEQGASAVAMEVSSHALDQQRVAGVPFELAIFTNLTRDHLDYHENMAAYGAAKAKLFEFASLKSAAINIDDEFGRTLYAQMPARIKRISFGTSTDSQVRAENIVLNSRGASFTLCVAGHELGIQSSLYGRFNVVNLLGVVAGLIALGYSVAQITPVLPLLQPIAGRMNRLGGGDQALVVVDYAHTPDALAQVLMNLREHLNINSGASDTANKLICVFGCGGDRDVGKRALMGRAAEEFADVVIITNDNPRSESETAITDQILAGIKTTSALVEHRRERAIELAILQANQGDIVLIAGKGHENYQEIRGVKHPFDDATVALGVLKKQYSDKKGANTSPASEEENKSTPSNGMNLTLEEFVALSGGTLISPTGTAPALDAQAIMVQSVSSDTRTLEFGGIFVAIKGEHVDGHSLLAKAQALGAVAALVSVQSASALPQILVPNVEAALAQLATAWCQRVPAKRVAITGSNGKTTVKNLTASILAQAGKTLATPGNLNNELGLPLTVLSIRQKHAFAVLEMGAGKPGDIRYLANIARPHVALVNNAMAAHLERLGDVHGVAEEKSSIYRALLPGGTAVINLDDAELPCFLHAASQAGAAKLTFSLNSPAADVYASDVKLGLKSSFTLHCRLGTAPISLALVGTHNVRNALAAASLAMAAGANLAQISAGLNLAASTKGRLKLYPQPGGWNLLDDSYNANPGSVKAGMEALVALVGHAWVVLGNMAELGKNADALHREVGLHALKVGVKKLFCLGEQAAYAAQSAGAIGETFSDIDALIHALKTNLTQAHDATLPVNLLIKGSRSAKMERVATLLGADIATVGGH